MLIWLTAQFILEKFARSAQQYMREKIFFLLADMYDFLSV